MFFSYLWYLCRHKWFVFVECCKLGIPWRGLLHDMSKFSPAEFKAYMEYFYGTPKFKNEVEFKNAWELHLKRNKHHWNYWVSKVQVNTIDDLNRFEEHYWLMPKEMPEVYVKEMVADWVGAGKAIHGYNDIQEWYAKNKSLMTLNYFTTKLVEKLLERY
jgi:hypothetical protein